MDSVSSDRPFVGKGTVVERVSDRALEVTRRFAAPCGLVYRAWTEPALFRRWWVPEGFGIALVACEMDVRTGGSYRLEFAAEDGATMAFFGRYLDVEPAQRIVWTNAEEAEGAVTTVTFVEEGGATLVTYHERYPAPAALDEAMAGSAKGLPHQFDQLEALLTAGLGD